MQEGAKRRLAGAVVIVALTVIFVPMLFEDESLAPPAMEKAIPDEPAFSDPFESSPPPAVDPSALTADDRDLLPESESLEPSPQESDLEEETGEPEILGEPGQLGLSAPLARTETGVVAEPAPRAVTRPPAARSTVVEKPVQPQKPAQPPKPVQPPKKEPVKEPVAEPPARAEGTSSWVVQVSSLGSSEAADALAGKLKQSGFSAFVEKADVGGKTYYRVRVGPDGDRANAERTAAMLRQKQKLDTLIQRYP